MTYTEGSTTVSQGSAFINPKAKFSRDATIAYLKLLKAPKNILDATSATGIRGIRYMKELNPEYVTFLEINKSVYPYLKKNLVSNGINPDNAVNLSFQEFCNDPESSKFDVIDVDPFGSPAPYVFDSMKIARNGSILCFTATDTAVLCGAHKQACIKSYDSVPMHNELGHEAGLRIMIGFIARIAAQFNYGIDVGLSFSYLHYLRVILSLRHGATNANSSIKNMGFAYKCQKCGWHYSEYGQLPTKSKCDSCGSAIETSGKLWLGALHDDTKPSDLRASISKVNAADEKGSRFMELISSEPNIPFYYSIPKLTKIMGLPSVSEFSVIEDLKSKGYIASSTHMEKNCIKTDAGIDAIKESIKALLKRAG